MRDKSEVLERAMDEAEAKVRAEDDMRKKYRGQSSLVLEILKKTKPRRGGSIQRQKEQSVMLKRGPRQKLIFRC